MRRGIDPISALFFSLACVAVVLFVAGFWWQSVWVVARMPTHDIRLLSGKGFVLQRIDPPGPDGRRAVYPALFSVPYVAVAGVLLVVPAVRLFARRLLSSRRRHAGACAACGYDLRASPGNCPECGHTPPPNS
jgi:hypothetical protein